MEMTLRQAEERCIEWGTEYKDRDNVVTSAYEAGMDKARIAELMGLGRSTVHRVIAAHMRRKAPK